MPSTQAASSAVEEVVTDDVLSNELKPKLGFTADLTKSTDCSPFEFADTGNDSDSAEVPIFVEDRRDQTSQPQAVCEQVDRHELPAAQESASTGIANSDLFKSSNFFDQLYNSAPAVWVRAIHALPKVYGLSDSEKSRIERKNTTFVTPGEPGNGSSFSNQFVIAAVGTFGKLLMSKLNSLSTYRMNVLYDSIESRKENVGLLTVSNHRSVVDDPLLLSALLPPRILYKPSLVRWGLCSLDICFQSTFYSSVCTLGKTLPMMRLGGLAQDYLKTAASKLSSGDWVHIYPEGRVRQRGMGYAKRGVGKIIAMTYEDNGVSPIVLPLYHEGAENVMPHDIHTHRLKSIIPRIGKKLYAIAGDPLDVSPILKRMMPACKKAGGLSQDPPECLRMYEELADFLSTSIRLLRIELRRRVKADHGVVLGDPYEVS